MQPIQERGAVVWVFGSIARGHYRPFSDLDVLYSAKNKMVPMSLIAKIQEDVENSSLPIKIDLVAEADLAESYRESILRERISV